MSNYGDFATYYDELTANVGYEERGEYLLSLLRSNSVNGGIMLDLACGTGSLGIFFAKKGFEVIGVDSSVEMLNTARDKAYENGVELLLLNQDMTELDLFGTVDCAICTLDSINHLTDENAVQKCFDSVSLFMNKGGIFVFDVNTPYKHREVLANNTFVYDTDGVYCIWQNKFNADRCETEISLDFFAPVDGGLYEHSEEVFCERAYSGESLKKMLESSGFEIISVYDEMTTHKPDEKTQREVYTVRKV